MFEDVTERLDPTPQKSRVRIKFVQTQADPAPRLVVILTKTLLESFKAENGMTCSLSIGKGEDTGKIKMVVGNGLPVGKLRLMKLGGAMIDYGIIKDADTLWGVNRPVPSKDAKVLTEGVVSNECSLVVEIPKWEAHEVPKPRGTAARKHKPQGDEKPAAVPQKTSTGPLSAVRPLVSTMPPAIVFRGKRATVTEFQATLLGAMANNFQALTPAPKLIADGYKATGREPPAAAEMSMPQALQGIQSTLRGLGLRVTYVKGEGWGLDLV